MARKLSSREVGLAVAFAVCGLVYLWMKSGADPVSSDTSGSGGGKAGAGASTPAAPVVRMDLLTREAASYGGAGGRDLFQYAQRPPSAQEIAARKAEEKRLREQAEAEAKLRSEQADRERQAALQRSMEIAKNPPKPPPPAMNLKFLGYLGRKDDKIAVLEDGDELIPVKKGDVIKGQFKVVDIRYETVVMGYTRPEFQDQTREISMLPAPK